MQIKREVAATGNVTEIYSIHLQSISAVDIYRYYLQKMSAMNIGYLPQCDSPLTVHHQKNLSTSSREYSAVSSISPKDMISPA
jgi:hypothetical protein